MTEGSDKCPYREVCPLEFCPGDTAEKEYEPDEGNFRLLEKGILCNAWDVLIPKKKLEHFRRPEGRPSMSLDAADKIDASRRKYSRSDKRKEAQDRFEATDKGQEVIRRYNASERAKLSRQKYYYTEKGKLKHQEDNERKKLMRTIAKFLQDNPSKTVDDYFKEDSNG